MEQLDADLVAAARQGDREALRGLYESSHLGVYQLMLRMVGPQDAADVTQQVYLQVFRCLDQFSGRAKFSTWLYRLAVNEALQHLRKHRRHRTVSLEQVSVDVEAKEVRHTEQREILDCALSRIDPELRLVFLLREMKEMSYAEIAEAVGIPEGTVGSRLNRARKELQGQLTALGWEPSR